MKNLIKIMSVLLVSVMVVLFTTTVNAAENDTGFTDLTGTLNSTSNNASGNTNSENTNISLNTNSNTNTNTNTKNNTNNTNANTNANKNKNTDLPKTGIEDSIPVAMLVVVFGISAVYAYKKINDYKNI